MSDETTRFKLDLDNESFLTAANAAKFAIQEVGDKESLSGLISALGESAALVGALGVAYLGIRVAFEAVMDAEKVEAVNAQFKHLATNAGVYFTELKEGLEESAGGFVSNVDLMQAANRAMVGLETGVKDLPELMQIARSATAIMGGTVLENFNMITRAVETGSTRMLRQVGIIIDQKKAYEEYAKAAGLTVETLSKADQQQAVLNAVLEIGKTKLSESGEELKKTTNAWEQTKVAFSDFKEALDIGMKSTIGPVIYAMVDGIAGIARVAKGAALSLFGTDAEKAAIHLKSMNSELTNARKGIEYIEERLTTETNSRISDSLRTSLEMRHKQVAALETEIAAAKGKIEATKAEQQTLLNETKKTGGDPEKKLAQEVKFDQEMLQLRAASTKNQISLMRTVNDADMVYNEERLLKVEEIENKIRQVRAAAARGNGITQAQAEKQVELLEHMKTQVIVKDEEQIRKLRKQALDQYVANSKTAAQGISNAWNAESKKAMLDLQDFGKFGTLTFDAFRDNAVAGFEAIGDGSKSAGDAMQGFMFGALGDIAEAQGKVLLASALLNPANGVAGAALLVLAGWLKGHAKGSSADVPSPSGGGAPEIGSAAAAPASGSAFSSASDSSFSTPGIADQVAGNTAGTGKVVNLVIQGHYFDTEVTRTQLVQLVRDSIDATDFNIKQVGER